MNYELIHVPVLLKEAIEMLDVKADGTYVDATVGPGGHAEALLSMLNSDGRLVGIDRDEGALMYARERLGNDRVYLKNGSFSQIQDILSSMNIREVDGILFDLGVSMLQMKELKRGFSFISEARLDMRMNTAQELTAWDVVNKYSVKDLERILKEYGEEPFAKRIAKAIDARRKKASIDTCKELANIVIGIYRQKRDFIKGTGSSLHIKTHPATRTFQALRIEVNKELDELKKALSSALNILKTGGRLCVISYHSLEDRVVKNFIRDNAREGIIKVLTKKPVTAGFDEIKINPSARSAKLRGAEKISSQGVRGYD